MLSDRERELQTLTVTWHNQMEAKNMTIGERERVISTLLGLHLMLTAVALDESLNIVSNRLFAKVLEGNETCTLEHCRSHNIPIKP